MTNLTDPTSHAAARQVFPVRLLFPTRHTPHDCPCRPPSSPHRPTTRSTSGHFSPILATSQSYPPLARPPDFPLRPDPVRTTTLSYPTSQPPTHPPVRRPPPAQSAPTPFDYPSPPDPTRATAQTTTSRIRRLLIPFHPGPNDIPNQPDAPRVNMTLQPSSCHALPTSHPHPFPRDPCDSPPHDYPCPCGPND